MSKTYQSHGCPPPVAFMSRTNKAIRDFAVYPLGKPLYSRCIQKSQGIHMEHRPLTVLVVGATGSIGRFVVAEAALREQALARST